MSGLLPKSCDDDIWVNTRENGGLISLTVLTSGEKLFKLVSFISVTVSLFEIYAYCNYTAIHCFLYVQGNNFVISQNTKGGSQQFKFVLKNENVYLYANSPTQQITVALRNIVGFHQIVLESTNDDITEPIKEIIV